MQGTQIEHWYNTDGEVYMIASVKTKSDSSQYAWATRYNGGTDSIEYTVCVDTPLSGSYAKASNLNFVMSAFSSTSLGKNPELAIRSQTHSGVLQIQVNRSSGAVEKSFLMEDSTGIPIDGQILFHSVTGHESKKTNDDTFINFYKMVNFI